MAQEINTKVSTGDSFNKKVPNLILEDARFFGRPNFSGEEDQFKDSRRKFNVLIPDELADQLRDIGWNVKTLIPTDEQKAEGMENLSFLKVMIDMNDDPTKGAQVYMKMGETLEQMSPANVGLMDRARFVDIGMEIRAWEYDPQDKPGQYSARLVKFVGVMEPSRMTERYGV